MRRRGILGLAILVFLSSVPPSWGWGHGRWGARGGSQLVVGFGGPWWPYGFPYDGYGPYYDPYYYDPPPYAYLPGSAVSAKTQPPSDGSADDNSPRDLKLVKERLKRMHELLAYKYEDGDILAADRDAGFRYLDEIDKLARSEYDSNGKGLTARQEQDLLRQIQSANPVNRIAREPYPTVTPTTTAAERPPAVHARQDLQAVNDLLLELHTLLDQKLKEGAITRPQHDAEAASLDRIDQQAHGGALTENEAGGLVQKLHQAYYAISHNFVNP